MAAGLVKVFRQEDHLVRMPFGSAVQKDSIRPSHPNFRENANAARFVKNQRATLEHCTGAAQPGDDAGAINLARRRLHLESILGDGQRVLSRG